MSDTNSNTTMPQNQDLARAFASIANARKALDELLEEKPFHSNAWKDAFYNVFDQLEALKNAGVRDAANLGCHYIQQLSNLMSALLEMPANRFSVADLCELGRYAGLDRLDRAKVLFEDVLQDLYEGTIYEDGTPVVCVRHKLHFSNEDDRDAAMQQLFIDWGENPQAENATSLIFETDYLLDEQVQKEILQSIHCVNYQFNIQVPAL